MQWLTLFQKEVLDNWENKKWIWVPLVFILLMMMDPLSYYYLPEIIEIAGGVPEGTVFEIPELQAEEVIMMSLEQVSMFGVLVIALISMGTITNEKKSGLTEMILVKPISANHYITSKWMAYLLLTVFSFAIAIIFSAYYIFILYNTLPIMTVLLIYLFYSTWLIFVLSLSIFYNSFARNAGIVLACTVGTIILMSIFNMIFQHQLPMFPNQLSTHIHTFVMTDNVSTELIATSIITLASSILLVMVSILIFNKSEKI
ncbi:MAG TPA: ABC transporter permease subunit [Pseudogracilibacillus sp.]|nr:ABC transporter permease subunit [Pseudogracilibacillus sp.]